MFDSTAPIRRSASRNTLGVKILFEVCANGCQFGRRLHGLKSFVARKDFVHLLKIIPVIGAQVNYALRHQRAPHQIPKTLIDEAMPTVL